MKAFVGVVILLTLVTGGAIGGVGTWREEIVVRAGYGDTDSLFGYGQIKGFCPATEGIFIMDGMRDEIKVFDYDGRFKKTLHVTWPDTTVFHPNIFRVYSDMIVIKGTIYLLAFCGIRPVDEQLRRRYTAYQLLTYSADTGELKAHYIIPDSVSQIINKCGGVLGSCDFAMLMVHGDELGFGAMFENYYPLLRNGKWVALQEQSSVIGAVPFGRGWFRTIRPDEVVELLDESRRLIKRMDGINADWVAKDGSLFTRYVGSTDENRITKDGDVITTLSYVYNHDGELIGRIETNAVVGSCNGFPEPMRGQVWERFGPDGCLYTVQACSDGVTLKRWCP